MSKVSPVATNNKNAIESVVSIDKAKDPGLEYIKQRFIQLPNQKSRSALILDTTNFVEDMNFSYLHRCYIQNGGKIKEKTKRATEDYLVSTLTYCAEKVFIPNAPRILSNKLNLWQPHPVVFSGAEVNKDQVPLYIEYIERLFPIAEERRYMHWWVAHTVCRPERKIIATPVLRSTQGAGKTFLTETLLGSIMGANASIGDLGHITGQFQDCVIGKTVIALDEVYCDKKRTVDALKVFQSNDKVLINQKHKAAFSIDNYINFIINSNDYDPVVFESHDRRFFIPQFIEHRVDSTETQQFIERLANWITKENGAQMIRDFLETINLDAYNPKAPAPMTISKQARIGYNFEDRLVQAVEDLIANEEVVKSVVIHQSLLMLQDRDFENVKLRKVAATLEQCGCIPKKSNSCTYQITPLGKSRGLSGNTPPKELEERISKVNF